MNERELLKELNSKANRDGDFTPAIVRDLLEEARQLQVAKRENIFVRLWRRNKKVKTAKQIIEDNLEIILERTANNQLAVLLELFMHKDETLEIVKDQFDMIIQKLQEKQTTEDDVQVIHSTRSKFLTEFKKMKDAEAMLVAHMDVILQGTVTLEDVKTLKGMSAQADEKLNRKLESQKQEVAREILSNIPLSEKSEKDRQQIISDYLPTAMRMVEELLTDQNAKMVDIERIGRGSYSKVYQIGEKVLKIGNPRETYKIPNHPRILQPLTRTNLIDEREDNKIFACVEVSNRTDKLREEDLQLERLYQLYKELRDDGIIWTDARYSNVGKLRRTNTPTLNGEKMNVDPVAVGMDKEINGTVLGIGEWVIIDTDYIYKEGDCSIEWPKDDKCYSQRFEKRWQQEKQGKIVARYQREEISRSKEDYTKSYESRSWGKKTEGEER